MQELDEFINSVKTVPPAPKVLPELLTLLNRPNTDADKVVKLISYDPGLSIAVLQATNSAFFATGAQTADISEAVRRLGFSQIFQIVCAVTGGKSLAPPQQGYGIDKGELWLHAVTAAVAAQLIARKNDDDENTVFTATLLHDLGKIVLSEALSSKYAGVMEEVESKQRSFQEAEKKILGVEHAEIGGRLLARWKFPQNVVSAVWFHHNPKGAGKDAKLAAYVYTGNLIAHMMGNGFGHAPFAMKNRPEAFGLINLQEEAVPLFMMETFQKMETVNALFALAA
jgi:putative nucleotidyltransferase with HDIG domain